MINPETLKKALCHTFCSSVTVNPVPCGFAVSTFFVDRSGDPIDCYVVEDGDGYRIEDDGEYLTNLIASGIPIDQGSRGQLLESILAQGDARWDQNTYEIKSSGFPEEEIGFRLTNFLSSLIRVRDLELLTREVVKSTFREDAIAALDARYGQVANFNENQAVDRSLSEFPADLIISPKQHGTAMTGALYFVTSNEKLSEALLLQMEAEKLKRDDIKIVALIEDSQMSPLNKKKFQRAQNRSLSMPIFRGDEDAAVRRIGRDLALDPAA
jgi:hypothetical protein